MRESIGGTMLFYIVLFFLTIFIFFIASVIRYARVYKIKNTMINYVERNEGVETKEEFDDELIKMGYKEPGKYKICRYYPSSIGGYYYIELYATFEVPIVGNWFFVDVAIKGDTHSINTGTKIKGSNWFTGKGDECKLCSVGGTCSDISID